MTISPIDSVGNVDDNGQTYYFCNQSCLERFRADPARRAPIHRLADTVASWFVPAVIAVAAVTFSSVSVISNALRLKRAAL
jgi:YHS domain-containing protein